MNLRKLLSAVAVFAVVVLAGCAGHPHEDVGADEVEQRAARLLADLAQAEQMACDGPAVDAECVDERRRRFGVPESWRAGHFAEARGHLERVRAAAAGCTGDGCADAVRDAAQTEKRTLLVDLDGVGLVEADGQ